jgi:hypothetical protein
MGIFPNPLKRTTNFIFLSFLLTACAFDFEPDIVPLDIQPEATQPSFGTIGPDPTINPENIIIPDHGTHETLLYCAELLGFGSDDQPSIDDIFDPYSIDNPLDDVLDPYDVAEPLDASFAEMLQENAEEINTALYGSMENFEQAVIEENNPLNYVDDPSSRLEGDVQFDLRLFMIGRAMSRQNLGLFLENIGADPSLDWNYEPAWLQAKMEAHPNELLDAQFQLLQLYASAPDSDTWWWLQP